MNYQEFKETIIETAKSLGVDTYDLFYVHGDSISVYVYDNVVDNFSSNTHTGICFRCLIDGKMGLSHTQLLSREEAHRLVKDASESTEILSTTSDSQIYKGGATYPPLASSTEEAPSVETLKEIAFSMESRAKNADSRIISVPYSIAEFSSHEEAIYNSYGVDLKNRQTTYTIVSEVVVEENGQKKDALEYQTCGTLDELTPNTIVDKAVTRAISTLGGSSVASEKIPVVFENKVVCSLLGAFSSVFSGDAARKGMSLLGDKIGNEIAAPSITITDDPLYSKSPYRSAFDDEGVPAFKKNIIENGVLKTLLYDLESASAVGVETTGNGRKASYSSGINVMPFNLYMQSGTLTLDELFHKAENGLFVTGVKGLHASANAATGDFSLEANGFIIQNGKQGRPVEQFTIAGNFYEFLQSAQTIGNDFFFQDTVGAPSLLIDKMDIAGGITNEEDTK